MSGLYNYCTILKTEYNGFPVNIKISVITGLIFESTIFNIVELAEQETMASVESNYHT